MVMQQECVQFHEDTLMVVRDENAQGWVAIKPICDALGVAAYPQRAKITSNPQFSWHDIMSTGTDGKLYRMFCIPVSQLNGWLYSINANKVKPESREKLLAYQGECQEVLFKHFMPLGGTEHEIQEIITRIGNYEKRLGQFEQEVNTKFTKLESLIESSSNRVKKETQVLIRKVRRETGVDGRSIVGHVRGTLGTSGIYNTANPQQVKNVLKNILDRSAFSLEEQDIPEEIN